MKLTDIPYAKLTDVKEEKEYLVLSPNDSISNHLGTIHAGAIFTLAESESGHYLQKCFPDQKDKVVAMVRDASIRYKQPASQKIIASATITDEEMEKFNSRFDRKGRSTITIDVEVKDIENTLISTASFLWYVQKTL